MTTQVNRGFSRAVHVMIIDSHSEQETTDAGRAFAQRLSAGDVLLLYGDLGAGKTAFVRGLALGLGASADDVSSPTFTLVQEYGGGRLTLFHADLYRLTEDEAADLGLADIGEEGVLAIEWADRLARPPLPRALTISIDTAGDDRRRTYRHSPMCPPAERCSTAPLSRRLSSLFSVNERPPRPTSAAHNAPAFRRPERQGARVIRMRHLLSALAVSCLLAAAVLSAQQQAGLSPDERTKRLATEKELQSIAVVERKVMMPMRDGVRLATDIYRPKNAAGQGADRLRADAVQLQLLGRAQRRARRHDARR